MRRYPRITWIGLALAWAGYWAPWIAHRAAALNLNGYELAEWITFLPGVRDGSLRLGRIDFLIPLACISLSTALAAHAEPAPPRWFRWAASALALLGAFAILPEYPFILTAASDPALRPALILGLLTMGGELLAGSIYAIAGRTHWREAARGFTFTGLGAIALGFTVRALVAVWPALADLFHAAPRLNWGPFVLGVGLVAMSCAEAPGLA